MPISSGVAHLRARHTALRRFHDEDDPVVVTARRDLKATAIEEYLARQMAEAPSLTADQLSRISALLRPGGSHDA